MGRVGWVGWCSSPGIRRRGAKDQCFGLGWYCDRCGGVGWIGWLVFGGWGGGWGEGGGKGGWWDGGWVGLGCVGSGSGGGFRLWVGFVRVFGELVVVDWGVEAGREGREG